MVLRRAEGGISVDEPGDQAHQLDVPLGVHQWDVMQNQKLALR